MDCRDDAARSENLYLKAFQLLYNHFGPQGWWPAESKIEMVVGAILTQNTNWKNVEKALENLRAQGLLEVAAISAAPIEVLAGCIQPSGYYNLKAKRLKNLVAMLESRYGGELAQLLDADLEEAREALLSVKGVGPETADSILLYAGGMPVFVVDAYTYRVFLRHNLVEEETDYHTIQGTFHDHLNKDARLFNEYHALIVRVAKEFCRKSQPLCTTCPLNGLNW